MIITDEFAPKIGKYTSEEIIHRRGATQLLNEIKATVRATKLYISDNKTQKGKGKGETGIAKLSDTLNKAFEIGFNSLGWNNKTAPGALHFGGKIDYFKEIPTGLAYGPKTIGLGLEVQFGNNYQTNEDYKKLFEFYITNNIVAGIEIVPSDTFAKYKADRGSSFSDAKKKLIRFLQIFEGLGVAELPPIMVIGIEPDGFLQGSSGQFRLVPAELSMDLTGEFIVQHKENIGTHKS